MNQRTLSERMHWFRVILILVLILLAGCSDCTETIRDTKPSPDDRFVAVLDYTNCGAGVSPISNVEVSEKGKVERIVAVSAPVTASHLEFTWTNASTLDIYCKKCDSSDAKLMQSSYRGIQFRLTLRD